MWQGDHRWMRRVGEILCDVDQFHGRSCEDLRASRDSSLWGMLISQKSKPAYFSTLFFFFRFYLGFPFLLRLSGILGFMSVLKNFGQFLVPFCWQISRRTDRFSTLPSQMIIFAHALIWCEWRALWCRALQQSYGAVWRLPDPAMSQEKSACSATMI